MTPQKNDLQGLKNQLIGGRPLSREDADFLINEPLEKICAAANEIRGHFCGNGFDLCSVMSGKCGKCSEGNL